MSVISFLHEVRELELNNAIKEMPSSQIQGKKTKLLEIGAGTGHQAKILTALGFEVTAIDLPSSAYSGQRVHPILDYDGENLPCQKESIQVVFSSNVLEHVKEIDLLLTEIQRVLVPGGVAIHILPTPSCRLWSLFAHYGWLMRRVVHALKIKKTSGEDLRVKSPQAPRNIPDLLKTLFPLRHGERGNSITEIYYYSESWWKTKFIENNYSIRKIYGSNIFYTMANFLNTDMSLKTRIKLSRILGSSTNIYITEKNREK